MEIRNNLLSVISQWEQFYMDFLRERQKVYILSTIHRANIDTFINVDDSKKVPHQKSNVASKEIPNAQKLIEIARLRKYNMVELFK